MGTMAHAVREDILFTSEKTSRKARNVGEKTLKYSSFPEGSNQNLKHVRKRSKSAFCHGSKQAGQYQLHSLYPAYYTDSKHSRKRSMSAFCLGSEKGRQSKVPRLLSAMLLRSEDMFLRSFEIKINVIEDVFSSISSLDDTLKSSKMSIPLPLLHLYTYTEIDFCQIPSFFQKVAGDTITQGLKEKISSREGSPCLEVVVLGFDDKNHTQRTRLSQKDLSVLRCFKKKCTSLQSSIFVVQTEDKDVDLKPISEEIAETLQENKRSIFMLVFHSKDRKIEERLEACLNRNFTSWMESHIKNGQLPDENIKTLRNEITKRKDMLPLHQIKTVSLRHPSVSGFGCIENQLCVYLKQNDPNEEKQVREYFKEFICALPDGFELVIEHKNRKIKRFTKLEQGSRIQKGLERSQQRYGSVGMFLRDKNGTYFMTTCAHVIGKNAYAYSPTDSTRLGQSILTFTNDSATGEGEEGSAPWMDFSLVKISPEKEIICQLGLKTSHDQFINGKIFKGDVSNIRDHKIYKWEHLNQIYGRLNA